MSDNPHQQAQQIAISVASSIRSAIVGILDDPMSGAAAGVASSGDTTFSMDIVAEKALEEAIKSLPCPVVSYSEDAGLAPSGSNPMWLLIVDPIDGTRPAAVGLNACAVSVAVAKITESPKISDVVAGAVYELRRDMLYVANKGGGAYLINKGQRCDLTPRPPADFCELRWTLETVARPALANFTAASFLIDETSLRGGLFALSSSAFSLCQLAAGKFSGMVDLSGRLLRDTDPSHEYARVVGHGRVMGMWAYDIAAAMLVATESGCTITDAWGESLDDLPLTRTEPGDMASCIAAASPEHHKQMLELINRGFRMVKSGQDFSLL